MRVAVLVDPAWKDPPRAYAITKAIVAKHPGADVVTAGLGASVYAAMRGALENGARVAAFQVELAQPRRGSLDLSMPPPTIPADVMLHELEPGTDEAVQLFNPQSRVVERARSEDEAVARALRLAVHFADEVVVLSPGDEWPAGVEGHRFAV